MREFLRALTPMSVTVIVALLFTALTLSYYAVTGPGRARAKVAAAVAAANSKTQTIDTGTREARPMSAWPTPSQPPPQGRSCPMPSCPSLMPALLIAASLSLPSGCASKERIRPLFPPAADRRVQPKPVLAIEGLSGEAVLDQHDIALETWGEAGWKAVAGICGWSVANGLNGVDCRQD